MLKTTVIALVAVTAQLGLAAHAAEPYPWGQRQAPFDFQFGNEIDTHQDAVARDGSIFGFFYVRFTGLVTQDGYPVATHVDCSTMPDCSVGWRLDGKPVKASFRASPDARPPGVRGSPQRYSATGKLLALPLDRSGDAATSPTGGRLPVAAHGDEPLLLHPSRSRHGKQRGQLS